MSFKPWLGKTFLDIRKSTERDYPPKRKKPWLTGSFPEMEHFHEGNYGPIETMLPPDAGPCGGHRNLWVIVEPPSLSCVDTDFSFKVSPDFQCVSVQQLFVDDNTVRAVDKNEEDFDEVREVDDLNFGASFKCGNEDPWLTFAVCDCLCGGCSIISVYLDDCEAAGSDITIEVASGSGCTAQYNLIGDPDSAFPIIDIEKRVKNNLGEWGEWGAVTPKNDLLSEEDGISIGGASYCETEYRGIDNCGSLVSTGVPSKSCTDCGGGDTVSGPGAMNANDTAQYSFNNTDGGTVSWSVSGSGATIDSNGLVTTVDACGTITVKAENSCCGDSKNVKIADAGYWGGGTNICSTSCISGWGSFAHTFEDGASRYHSQAYINCPSEGSGIDYEAACSGATPYPSCDNIDSYDWAGFPGGPCEYRTEIHIWDLDEQLWECIP